MNLNCIRGTASYKECHILVVGMPWIGFTENLNFSSTFRTPGISLDVR